MRILTLASIVALITVATAQNAPVQGPTPGVTAPAAATPPPAPKPTHIDFTIPMKPLKQKDLSFSLLKNRWSFIIYFSPGCPHCQHTFPYIRGFRDKYEKKGMAFAAMATGYASAEDIADFDQNFHMDLLAFQDDTKKFSTLYGTGSVPLMLLVAPDGTYQTWNASDSTTIAAMETAIKKSLKVK